MIKLDQAILSLNYEVYAEVWLTKVNDEDPKPTYCNQDEQGTNNNCIAGGVGGINYDSDCCKSWADRCRGSKGISVLGSLHLCLTLTYMYYARACRNVNVMTQFR